MGFFRGFMVQAILTYVHERCHALGYSAYRLAVDSGVSAAGIRRVLSRHPFREWSSVERALIALDVGLVVRDEAGATPLVCSDGASAGSVAIAMARRPSIRLGNDALLGLVSWRCRVQHMNAHRLHRRSGLPYACARNLVAGTQLRVSMTLQRVLSALGCAMSAVLPDGSVIDVPLAKADGQVGRMRREAHVAYLRRYHHDRPEPRRGRLGRLQITKAQVLDLRRRNQLSYAEIGRIAGVSRHRIRQIVLMFDRHAHA